VSVRVHLEALDEEWKQKDIERGEYLGYDDLQDANEEEDGEVNTAGAEVEDEIPTGTRVFDVSIDMGIQSRKRWLIEFHTNLSNELQMRRMVITHRDGFEPLDDPRDQPITTFENINENTVERISEAIQELGISTDLAKVCNWVVDRNDKQKWMDTLHLFAQFIQPKTPTTPAQETKI